MNVVENINSFENRLKRFNIRIPTSEECSLENMLKEGSNMNNYESEFYKYAYTELLHRHAVASCDKVSKSINVLQSDIDALLRDTQELIYNCTPAEVAAVKAITQQPVEDIKACAKNLAETLAVLQKYKSSILSSDDLL